MLGAMAFIVMSAVSLTARAQDPLKLESIDVQTLSGQQVQLKLHLSGPAPEPLPFTIDKPARIAFDLPNVTLALASRRIDVRSGGVDTVLAAEANGRTRVVVNVDSLLPYTTKVDGNTILVTLGTQPGGAAKQAAMAGAGSAPGAAAAERDIGVAGTVGVAEKTAEKGRTWQGQVVERGTFKPIGGVEVVNDDLRR